MPTRIYAPNKNNPSTSNWQTPSSISIYNDGWKTVKVAYNYDMGIWRVVYPDPIIPLVTIINAGRWVKLASNSYYVEMVVNTYPEVEMTGYLYSGSVASGTPIQTSSFTYSQIIEGYDYYVRFYVSSPGTYTIKAVAKSITENEVAVTSNPINVYDYSVSITSYNITINSYSVSWTSSGQEDYFIGIQKVGDSTIQVLEGWTTNSTKRSASGTISPTLLGNTQYNLLVGVKRSVDIPNAAVYSQVLVTTPSAANPIVSNLSYSSTCSSITLNWINNESVASGVITLERVIAMEQSMFIYGAGVNYSFTSPTNSYTFTNLTPLGQFNVYDGYYRMSILPKNSIGNNGEVKTIDGTTQPISAPAPPSNFTAISSEYGSRVDLYWTAPPTGSCITANEGYSIQYKLSSSNEWITLSNTIANTSTTYSTTAGGVTTTANTAYDFRIWTRSSPTNSTYAYASVTTNNTPYSVYVYTLPLATTTFSTVTVYAQLRNISNANVALSGRTVTFSATAGRGTFSATTANTNANGLASVTYTTNATTGNIDFFGQSAGVPVTGSYSLSVSLSPGLTPSLSVARTNFGYDITHSNYNSSYSYSGSVGGGGFLSGGNWNTNFYTIIIPPINTAEPSASYTSTQVTCTSGSWNANPSSTTTVTSSRTGYTDASASVTNSPTGSITTYDYVWYFDDGTVWGSGQTRNIGALVKGRKIRCLVTVTRTGGNQNWAWSKFITVPA